MHSDAHGAGGVEDETMRRQAALACVAMGMGLAIGSPAAAQTATYKPPVCQNLACDVQRDWSRNIGMVALMAQAMPDDKFGYKSTPPQRTFAEQVMHVVDIDILLIKTLGGKTPEPAIARPATTKAAVLAALRQAGDYGTAVLKEFDDAQLAARVPTMEFMGPTSSRLSIVYFLMAHTQDIYGQLAVYMRLNGVTPPLSAAP
jgi:uncharacterized damage-inducible protein DinB